MRASSTASVILALIGSLRRRLARVAAICWLDRAPSVAKLPFKPDVEGELASFRRLLLWPQIRQPPGIDLMNSVARRQRESRSRNRATGCEIALSAVARRIWSHAAAASAILLSSAKGTDGAKRETRNQMARTASGQPVQYGCALAGDGRKIFRSSALR